MTCTTDDSKLGEFNRFVYFGAIQMNTYGFTPIEWERALNEATEILIKRAKANTPISYSDFVSELRCIQLDAYDYRLFHLLEQVSEIENKNGRGMLSALVINRSEGLPGAGFFTLAQHLGRSGVSDELKFWITELRKVHEYWSNDKNTP